jgi:hypothetical protein
LSSRFSGTFLHLDMTLLSSISVLYFWMRETIFFTLLNGSDCYELKWRVLACNWPSEVSAS